jgi:dienelactone hydrolase
MRTLLIGFALVFGTGADWPALPEKDGPVELPAQEWPQRPGARTVRVSVHYPNGKLESVGKQTGLMLTLHNWGGTDCVGTANPRELAAKLDVVAVCVNYLQSGKADSIDGPEPYDFGYLQALDALRALWWLDDALAKRGKPYEPRRTFCTGGSGGGNVTLMANKLAPRTFACVIDLCGMKKLSDDIAFNLPGGSDLNARYSRDPKSKNYLSIDEQELRFVGNPDHLAEMKRLGAGAKVVTVHGTEDTTCPFVDAEEMAFWMKRARLDVEPNWIAKKDLDGKVFTSAGHALGNRTQIVLRFDHYLLWGGRVGTMRDGKSDFERREDVRYRTSNGAFVISYADGYPVGKFEPAAPVIEYADHTDLSFALDRKGNKLPVRTAADWALRREHVAQNFARATGPLPSPMKRVPLDVKEIESVKVGNLIRRKVTFASDGATRVPAYIFAPAERPAGKLPAILALHQTTRVGKDEPAGLGNKDMAYGLELAQRGYVVIVPDYPSFGEYKYDFAASKGYASGTMRAIWDNVRAVDVLETLPEVDAERIGVIGHSLGGHNAIFTAFFDTRLKAVVSNCGFCTFQKDDVPSWTGPVYMPRIKTEFGNDAKKVPFDFQELVAGIAPRAFLASAADKDNDFDLSGVKDCVTAAKPIYKLLNAADKLETSYYAAGHSFPPAARKAAYEFLDRHLKK